MPLPPDDLADAACAAVDRIRALTAAPVRRCREFHLIRSEDYTGLSGTGLVAVGVEFPNGQCVLQWLPEPGGIEFRACIEHVEALHGHGGRSTVVFLDPEDPS